MRPPGSKERSAAGLVVQARAGDSDAFTDLVREHQDRAYATALTMLGDPGRAQDAVQEAFLVAFRNLEMLRAPEAFGSWVQQITRHQASRILRSHRPDLLLGPSIRSSTPDPADAVVRREDMRQILRAIDALPEAEREATILFYLKDQSQKAVASLLRVPVTTVNNRLHAARAKLKGELLPMLESVLEGQALPADFADALGRVIRIDGAVGESVPRLLSRLGAEATGAEPVETGIKVLDLLCPIADGGTLGLFGDQRVGKLVLVEELTHNLGGKRSQPVIFTFVRAPEEVDVYAQLLAHAGPLPSVVIAAEEASEGALRAAHPFLDASVFMSRLLVDDGIYPAVDPRRSWSRLLDPAFVGARHWEVANRVLDILRQADQIGPQGARARRIRNFLSQPFFVAEPFTKRPGTFVPLADTVASFEGLLSGEYDQFPEDAFLMLGKLDF